MDVFEVAVEQAGGNFNWNKTRLHLNTSKDNDPRLQPILLVFAFDYLAHFVYARQSLCFSVFCSWWPNKWIYLFHLYTFYCFLNASLKGYILMGHC